MAEIQSPNIFGSFLAGRQAQQGEEQQAIRNQFAMRQQQMQEQEFQQQQDEFARQQQFNQLVGDYLGQDTVETLGVPQGSPQGAPARPRISASQLFALDPARASQVVAFQDAQAQRKQLEQQEKAKEIVLRAQYALRSEAPATLLRVGFPELAEQLKSQGVDVDNLDDDTVRGYAQTLIAQFGPVAGIAPADSNGEQFTLSEGQTRFGPDGKPIASVAKAPTAEEKDPSSLRKEFNDRVGGFQTIRSAYENVKTAERGDAGDTQLVLNYMRVISPGIRLQPGEQIADAASVPGVPTGAIAMWNKLVGGGKLNDSQRAELRSQAKTTYDTQRKLYDKTRGEYRNLARKKKFDEVDVVGEDLVDEAPQQSAPAGKGAAPAAAIAHLRAHPELADAFKQKYGYLPQQ